MFFLQEKNGNTLVGGYPPPPIYWKKTNIFPFFLLKASLSAFVGKQKKTHYLTPQSKNEKNIMALYVVKLLSSESKVALFICQSSLGQYMPILQHQT